MDLSKTDSNENFCFYRSINTRKLNLIWEITSICNLNCRHCFRYVSNDELCFEDKCRIAAKFDKSIIGRVLITGGEPFLVENIIKIIQEIQVKNIPVKMVSNLSFDKKIVDTILRELTPNFEMSTSIEGHNDEIHGYVRGHGKFELACKNIKYLVNNKINVSTICVVTQKNILYVEEIIKLCKNIGIKTLTFSKMLKNDSSIQCHDFYVTNAISEQEEIDFLSNIQNLRKKYSDFNIRTVGFVTNKCVDAGKNILFVTPQGEVHPCSMMRYNVDVPNIMNYSIDEIVDKIKNTSDDSFIRLCSSLTNH